MKNTNWNHWKNRESWTTKRLIKQRSKPEFLINPRGRSMVDIIPSSQLVIGHGAFSIVYRAKLKTVSSSEQSFHWLKLLICCRSYNVIHVVVVLVVACGGQSYGQGSCGREERAFPEISLIWVLQLAFLIPTLNFDFPSLPLPTSYICFIFHLWKRLLGAESSLVTLGGADFHTACMRL